MSIRLRIECPRLVLLGLLVLGPAGPVGASPPEPLRLEAATPALGPDRTLVENVGFVVAGGRLAPVLRAGRACPCERTVSYSTALDGQTEIPIRVARAANDVAGEATDLGTVEIRGVEPLPAGRAHVRVTLRVAREGVEIFARDARDGRILEVVPTAGPAAGAP